MASNTHELGLRGFGFAVLLKRRARLSLDRVPILLATLARNSAHQTVDEQCLLAKNGGKRRNVTRNLEAIEVKKIGFRATQKRKRKKKKKEKRRKKKNKSRKKARKIQENEEMKKWKMKK